MSKDQRTMHVQFLCMDLWQNNVSFYQHVFLCTKYCVLQYFVDFKVLVVFQRAKR